MNEENGAVNNTSENNEVLNEVPNDASCCTKDEKNKGCKKCCKFKKIIPFILVGAICFVAGFGTDRMVMRHNFNGRPMMQQDMQRNMKGNFKGQNHKNQQNGQNGQNGQTNQDQKTQ